MHQSSEKKKLRVLCLHGYRQNENTFREKTGGLRKALKSRLEFEFLSAPLTPNVDGSNGVDQSADQGPRAWWFSTINDTFSSKDVTDVAVSFDETVEYLLNFVREKASMTFY
ncbi:serine hydrolase (FSH1) domain-containing protein [Ditylenchus destructor]|nr:serine hydrolase (FSH1) domain-containing protein [Ditylenchus destructor]